MIDCHTHLTDAAFDADRDAVLQRARAAGVERIAVVGQDLAENRAVLAAAGDHAELLPFLGLHPDRFADRAAPVSEAEQAAVLALIREQRLGLTGIGEVGLDYWVCQDETRRAAQREAFAALVRLALEVDLPLNVHSRSAGHHTIDLLLELGARRVLMHAFDGKAGHALRGAEAGFLFSVPPSIVRSQQKRKLVRALPLEALALETDSPVLGPEPGVRNEPANVAISAAAIAEIKGLAEPEVRAVTAANARRLFRLPD
ncbi:MAG TPA: TatD family hydrolase [bacterium]|nr:TatD family hydrolase [bacterium]